MRGKERRSSSTEDRQVTAGPAEQTAQGRGTQIDVALDEDIKRLVERSTSAQGLPFHVQDPAVLARVAALVQAALGKKAAHRTP
jgi:hypothetical protein